MSALAARLVAPGIASPKPLYAQVRDLLLGRVRGGEWGAGETLPNEFVLASNFDVSVGTVRRAVAELEAIGVLVRKQGRGTFVAGRGAGALQEKFSRLRLLSGDRFAQEYTLFSLSRRGANVVESARLPSGRGHGVIEIVQHVEKGGGIIGIETSILPAALFPRLETQMRFGQHLYPVLADYGCLVTRVMETIGLETADASVATQLGIESGRPLLYVERIAIGLDDMAVEWRIGRYLADAVRYANCAAS